MAYDKAPLTEGHYLALAEAARQILVTLDMPIGDADWLSDRHKTFRSEVGHDGSDRRELAIFNDLHAIKNRVFNLRRDYLHKAGIARQKRTDNA